MCLSKHLLNDVSNCLLGSVKCMLTKRHIISLSNDLQDSLSDCLLEDLWMRDLSTR